MLNSPTNAPRKPKHFERLSRAQWIILHALYERLTILQECMAQYDNGIAIPEERCARQSGREVSRKQQEVHQRWRRRIERKMMPVKQKICDILAAAGIPVQGMSITDLSTPDPEEEPPEIQQRLRRTEEHPLGS